MKAVHVFDVPKTALLVVGKRERCFGPRQGSKYTCLYSSAFVFMLADHPDKSGREELQSDAVQLAFDTAEWYMYNSMPVTT